MLALIQARLGSKRLPGKVLMEINGKPLLQYVVERVRLAVHYVVVVCPYSDVREIGRAVDCNVHAWEGDENDVWSRFRDAILKLEPRGTQEFIRICADSPLIDPAVIKYVMQSHKISHPSNTSLVRGLAFLTSNTRPRTWPAGQCVEICDIAGFMTFNKMGRGRKEEDKKGDEMTAYDREHVLPWYYRNCITANVTNPLGDYSRFNMVVDTQEDFDRINQLILNMDRPHWTYGWRELAGMMQ